MRRAGVHLSSTLSDRRRFYAFAGARALHLSALLGPLVCSSCVALGLYAGASALAECALFGLRLRTASRIPRAFQSC